MKSKDLTVKRIADDLFQLSPPSPMWPATACVYVVVDNGSFSLIDVGCGRADAIGRLKAGLTQLGFDFTSLKTLVLSHAHPDHMGAAEMLLGQYAPEVLIHTDDVDNARDPRGLIGTFDIELATGLYGKAEGIVKDLFSFFDGSG